MELKTWLESERGRANALAKAIEVPPSFVSKMASGEKPIPVNHMAEIERITGGEVTRIDMFGPGWQKIWPELATPTPPANAPQEPAAVQGVA